jgi:proline dehydrogenase
MIEHDMYSAIATHDKYLIEKATGLLKLYERTFLDYEFQMLLGVTPKLRTKVVAQGHSMRVYVPYGEQWFQYSARRLQENPHMVWDIIKAIFIRN